MHLRPAAMRRFTSEGIRDETRLMNVSVTSFGLTHRRHGVFAALALLLVLSASLWPLAQARLVAQGGPLTRILCSGFARAPLTAEARASLQRLADLTGDDSLRPIKQIPSCPCQGCFLHGHSLAPVLPGRVQLPVRMVRIVYLPRAVPDDALPSQRGQKGLQARAPPAFLFSA